MCANSVGSTGTYRDGLVAGVRERRGDLEVRNVLNGCGCGDLEEEARRRGDGDSRENERGEGRTHDDREGLDEKT